MNSSNIVHVQGVTLDIDKKSSLDFFKEINYVLSNSYNLWKNVDLHITLHLFSFNTAEESMVVIPSLEKIFNNLPAIKIDIGEASINDDGYIFLKVISNNLKELHLEVIEELKEFTSNKFNPKYLNTNLLPNQLEYLNKYGYHRVREYFEPHITIAKFENREEQLKVFEQLSEFNGTLVFNKVSLGDNIDKSYTPSITLWERELV